MYTQIEGDTAILIHTVEICHDDGQNVQVDMHVTAGISEFFFEPAIEQSDMDISDYEDNDTKLPFMPLTERELEVVKLIMQGYLTKQVAAALHIAIGTVRNHVKSIYQKLDAHSRVQLINKVTQYNLVSQANLA